MKNIELTIDGKIVSVEQGKSVLDAALENGVDIPHICYDPRLTPTGSCRLCLVEIEGQRGLQTSCSRIAEEGMVVSTETKEIAKSRKSTLELMISEHRMVCATCDADGDCLLQDYAYRYHVNEDRFPKIKPSVKAPNYTNYHKAIQYDPTKCVRCMRCVKVCEEVQGANAITLRERAGQVLVTTAFNTALKDSSCESCGQCVEICPVGAMTNKPAAKLGKVKDLEKVLTTCVYCGVGCQLELNVDRKNNRLVKVTSTPGIIPNDGNTCVKGRFGMDFIGSPERLTHPLIKENGEFRKASWDEALDYIAKHHHAVCQSS